MSEEIDRFKKLRKRKKEEIITETPVDKNLVNGYLNSPIEEDKIINKEADVFLEVEFNEKELIDLYASLKGNYSSQRLELLIDDCKSTVLDSIIRPFGIGQIVAGFDKKGGNVDTINNARHNVYATEKERNKANNNLQYDKNISAKYHSDSKYKNKNREGAILKKENKLKDEYTGKIIKPNEKSNLDHVISAKEIHEDKGRILADKGRIKDGIELANADSNLKFTQESINKFKKQKSAGDFTKDIDKPRTERQREIKELRGKKELTDQQRKKLEKLEKIESVNIELLKDKDKQARKEYNRKLNDKYYKSKKFIEKTAITSAHEGVKMGLQQAIGVVMYEFSNRVFEEIKDIRFNGFKNGTNLNESFFKVLGLRLKKIGEDVLTKWKDVVAALEKGFFSGFFSNIITVIINAFKTTSKRAVRMIREGFFSLLKALRVLILPPEDMTLKEAAHESTKLIVAGLAITGGILLEESVQTFLKSIPFSDMITAVIMGIVTGLTTSFLIFLLDEVDIFGVNADNQKAFVLKELKRDIDISLNEAEDLLKDIDKDGDMFFELGF